MVLFQARWIFQAAKSFTLILGLSQLAACAHKWAPEPGYSAAELASTQARCRIAARHSGGSFEASGSAKFVIAEQLGNAIGEAVRANQDVTDCMIANHFRIADDDAAPAPQPAPREVAFAPTQSREEVGAPLPSVQAEARPSAAPSAPEGQTVIGAAAAMPAQPRGPLPVVAEDQAIIPKERAVVYQLNPPVPAFSLAASQALLAATKQGQNCLIGLRDDVHLGRIVPYLSDVRLVSFSEQQMANDRMPTPAERDLFAEYMQRSRRCTEWSADQFSRISPTLGALAKQMRAVSDAHASVLLEGAESWGEYARNQNEAIQWYRSQLASIGR